MKRYGFKVGLVRISVMGLTELWSLSDCARARINTDVIIDNEDLKVESST